MSPDGDALGFRGVRAAYDAVAEDYAAHLPDTRAEAPLDLAMVDAFAEAVAAGGHASVLDAGCGAGRMSRYLAERGCRVTGVDLSVGMVGMAVRDHGDLTFTTGSLTQLPFPDDVFGGVMLWYSTIHTPTHAQARVFREAARVVRPGGHVLVGFQAGEGRRDLAESYRRLGHDIRLDGISTPRTRCPPGWRRPACARRRDSSAEPAGSNGTTRRSFSLRPAEPGRVAPPGATPRWLPFASGETTAPRAQRAKGRSSLGVPSASANDGSGDERR